MLPLLKTTAKISLIPGLFFILAWTGPVSGADAIYIGTINAYKLNIRSQPSQDSDVVRVVEKGVQVDVTAQDGGIGGWLTVEYKGQKGFIRNRPQYILLTPVGKSRKKRPGPIPRQKKSERNASAALEEEEGDQAFVVRRKIQKKIEKEEQRVADFSEKELEIIEGLNAIDYALNQARIKAEGLSKETRGLEESIHGIQTRKHDLAGKIAEDQTYAGQRLAAIYRMSMIGSLDMMAAPSSVFDFFIKQNAMKRVISSDFELLEDQTRSFRQLSTLESDLSQKKADKKKLEEDLSLQIRIKEKESDKKNVILHEIRRKKKLSQAALASLKQNARALDQKMYAIEKQVFHPIDDSVFSRQKGRLPKPVKGTIISRYGRSTEGKYNALTFKSGIDIRVERGEPVRSVFKGEVMFSDWLKGYGNILIINHGEHYYTLYAHVQEVFKKKGEKVETGEVIATAGDTGSIKGLCLHFEVRHYGKPVNPMKWLKKGV